MSKTEYKKTLAKFATGVTVVTTNYKENLAGITINSFASVSLEPQLISFCLDNNSSNLEQLLESDYFNVNILSSTQEDLARLFAEKDKKTFIKDGYKTDENNIALLDETVAHLRCKKFTCIKAGDHHIILGEVFDFGRADDRDPLLYFNSEFQPLK